MSTNIELKKVTSVGLTAFWGGNNKGSCIQITQSNSKVKPDTILKKYHSLLLTRKEAMTLGLALLDFGRNKEVKTYKDHALKDWWTTAKGKG